MQASERNPFHEMSLTELADAIRSLKRTLQEPKSRTREERAELANQTIKLLAVVADRLEPKPFVPHCPEYYPAKGRSDMAQQYIAWHRVEMERAQRAVRYRTLSRMANLVLGTKADPWIYPPVGALDARPLYKGSASDEGLFECLQQLEVIARSSSENVA